MSDRVYCVCYTKACYSKAGGHKSQSVSTAKRHIEADQTSLSKERATRNDPYWLPPANTPIGRAYRVTSVDDLEKEAPATGEGEPAAAEGEEEELAGKGGGVGAPAGAGAEGAVEEEEEMPVGGGEDFGNGEEEEEALAFADMLPDEDEEASEGEEEQLEQEQYIDAETSNLWQERAAELNLGNRDLEPTSPSPTPAGTPAPADVPAAAALAPSRSPSPFNPEEAAAAAVNTEDALLEADEAGAVEDEGMPDAAEGDSPFRGRIRTSAGYVEPGPHPPEGGRPPLAPLSEVERWSIRNYVVTVKNFGTTRSFHDHGLTLAKALNLPALRSQKACEAILRARSGFSLEYLDICPFGCLAFTGEFEALSQCPAKRMQDSVDPVTKQVRRNKKGNIIRVSATCNSPRYHAVNPRRPSAKPRPIQQAVFFPFLDRFRAWFGNPTYAELLRYFHKRLSANMELRKTNGLHLDFSKGVYHDVPDGENVAAFADYFLDPDTHTSAFMLNVDGARLDRNRPGEMWAWTMTVYSFSPEIRVRRPFHLDILLSIAPNNPSNLESYNFFIYERVMDAACGFWMWDALAGNSGAWRMWRGGMLAMCADLMGSRKCSGLRVVSGSSGCGDCLQLAVTQVSGKGKYYARAGGRFYERTVGGRTVNAGQPQEGWDPARGGSAAPLRTQEEYEKQLKEIYDTTTTATARKAAMQQYGISFAPLAIDLPLFNISTFFPVDVSHLLSNNVGLKFLELFKASGFEEYLKVAGGFLVDSQINFPSTFGTFLRDPALFSNTQYRLFELALWIRFFSLPTLRDAGFEERYPQHFQHWGVFVRIFSLVTGTKPLTPADRNELKALAEEFNTTHERLYVQFSIHNVSRFPLCIHRLLHLADYVSSMGNPAHYSQLALERRIKVLKDGATSQAHPFAAIVHRTEVMVMLDICRVDDEELDKLCADFDVEDPSNRTPFVPSGFLYQTTYTSDISRFTREVKAIKSFIASHSLSDAISPDPKTIKRLRHYGKASIEGGDFVSSVCAEEKRTAESARRYSWFVSTSVGSDGALVEKEKEVVTLGRVVVWVKLERREGKGESEPGAGRREGDPVEVGKLYAVVELFPPGNSLFANGTAPFFPSSPSTCVLLPAACVEEVVAVYESQDERVYVLRKSEAGAWGFARSTEEEN